MKKLKIFLIAFLVTTLFPSLNVFAEQKTFYESNYIPGIWMNKTKDAVTYYQTARFFREKKEDAFVYCIEPFAMFNGDIKYESTLKPSNLSQEQIDKISLISHFGYGYTNHKTNDWYAITQMMIWKEADPTGDYYFTDSLNGNRVNIYEQETKEINDLVNDFIKKPDVRDEYNLIEGEKLYVEDKNDALRFYNYINPIGGITVNVNNKTNKENEIYYTNNLISSDNLKEGNYTLNLAKKSLIFNRPIIFYEANNTQNMLKPGDLARVISIKISVTKTRLHITKIDSDTKTTISSGEGQLKDTEYELLDSNMNKISTLKIGDDMTASLEGLSYGKYYLKEIKPGIGYELDKKVYEIEISKENPKIELILENNIIKKKIIINKQYGDGKINNFEANISFNIYNNNNELVKTITTNNQGYAEILLPYGNYTIKQINSTEGYELTDDITLEVKDTTDKVLNLYDYKIKVPNTRTHDSTIYLIISILIIGNTIVYVKKRNNN